LQDIVHRPASTEWLVTASWVEGEGAEQLAIVGDDAYAGAGDQELDSSVLVEPGRSGFGPPGRLRRRCSEREETSTTSEHGGVHYVLRHLSTMW